MSEHTNSRKLIAALAIGVVSLAFSGCTTFQKGEQTTAQKHATIDSSADKVLSRLSEASPDARSAVANAKGVLIFPKIMSGGLVVGFDHGDGVLRINNKDQGYYTTASGSIGLQAGVQSRAMVLLFMTQEALDDFRNNDDGWTVGAGATVAVAKIGANGTIDSETLNKPVVAFVMTNGGLAAGVSLKGTKISKMKEGQ